MTIVEKQTDELVENRHLQNQLLENEKIYRSALELTCERVFEADLIHNKLIYGQDIYNRTFPFLKTELYGDIIESITENAIYYEDVDKFYKTLNRRNLIQLFTTTDTTEVNVEYRQVNEDGENVWVSATIIHLSEDDDHSLKVIGYVKNIDARKRSELEILKQSQKDGLTNLYNKMVTQSLIENYLLSEGSSGRHAAIMLDIDNFKHINDTLGHIQGDAALLQVAEKLQGLFRATDIVGRIGGDEFFILLKNYVSTEKLVEKLTAVCDLFKDIFLDEGGGYRISGSVGVSLYPEDGRSYTELYKEADHALYFAKEHGKNCYSICNNSFSDRNHRPQVDLAMVKHTDFQYVPHDTQIEDLA
jgi:diguanylate cyclase (GGDEF)-like protein